MGIGRVLRIFRNSTLITAGEELTISRVFPTCKAAKRAHYRYFRIDNGTMIYTKRTKTGRQKYAVIGD